MDQWVELWDTTNGSLVGTFNTCDEALVVVRRSLDSFGPDSVGTFLLTREECDGRDPTVIAAGAELAQLARQEVPSLAEA